MDGRWGVMFAAEVKDVVKSYADKRAVDHLSFAVARNEIFGLIGPNGAGKTTTIRMMMDILKPDSGEMVILGSRPAESTKASLGYLPEERGLYKKLTVMESIAYLASLKGMNRHAAETRSTELLERAGLLPHKRKKIEELSKGMAQVVQFIVTIVHDPELVILDEPFTSLDPVNTELIRELISELRERGKTVILRTHQMNQVEEVCDRILMIHHGKAVLYGDLREIKREHAEHSVIVDADGDVGAIEGVVEQRPDRDGVELILAEGTQPHEVLERLVGAGVHIRRFEVSTPSLNEIFLRAVSTDHE
jgi:ABC-2 type transport system ATP-binding protein